MFNGESRGLRPGCAPEESGDHSWRWRLQSGRSRHGRVAADGPSTGNSTPALTRDKWPSSGQLWLCLSLLLAANLALRVWYANGWLMGGRFFDENVNVANVVALLEAGRFEPANGFYPTLAYLPQTLAIAFVSNVQELLGLESTKFVTGTDLTPAGYLLCRVVSVSWGTGALLATFFIGWRLFDPATGLMAFIVFAASPWQIHTSAYFKPDNLVSLTLGVTFLWTLRALENLSLRRLALVGAGIALSMSSKFTAVSAPALLIVPTLLEARRRPRMLLYLVIAGVVSLGIFLCINPQLDLFIRDFGWTTRDYERHAAAARMSRWTVLAGALKFPFTHYAHGKLVGLGAALGALYVGRLLFRGRAVEQNWMGKLLLLVFPAVFALAYAGGTPRLKENNFVPILMFTSILASVAIVNGWRQIEILAPELVRRVGRAVGVVVLIAWVMESGWTYVYRSMVPSTQDVARRQIAERLTELPEGGGSRLVVMERIAQLEPQWEGRPKSSLGLFAEYVVDECRSLPDARRRLADFEVCRLGDRIEHSTSSEVIGRMLSRPFSLRGPDLEVRLHAWRALGPPRRLKPRDQPVGVDNVLARLPDHRGTPGVMSLSVWLPFRELDRFGVPRLALGEELLDLHWVARSGRGHAFITERFLVNERELTVGLAPWGGSGNEAEVDALEWRADGP